MPVIFMTSSLTKRFKMSLTLSNKGNKKIDGVTPCMVEYGNELRFNETSS